MPCEMPLACFILSDRRPEGSWPVRAERQPSALRGLVPESTPYYTCHIHGTTLIMTTEREMHQAWIGQTNLPNTLQYIRHTCYTLMCTRTEPGY